MKIKLLFSVLICLSMASCNSGNDQPAENAPQVIEAAPDTVSTVTSSADSAKTIINRDIIWTVDDQNSGKEKLVQPQDPRLNTYTSAHLIELINNNYPEIHLELVKVSHDTMYVKIPDSKRLTEGLGSTGAENYMASATYTLTESKNVKYVNFDMKEGDHAGPGVFSRNDFKRLR